MQAYCFKCRTKREIKNPQQVTLKNGRPATQGVCPVCGTKLFRIGIPLGKIATPEDQAKTILFVASEAADHITGQTIHVDGGQSIF